VDHDLCRRFAQQFAADTFAARVPTRRSIVEGVIRILTTLALAVALAVASPGIAVADPTPSPGASTEVSPAPAPSPADGARVGGTPGEPGPAKPGWVWWIGAAIVVAFGAGGVRIWRSRWTEYPPEDSD
jgi:hypothetical protein